MGGLDPPIQRRTHWCWLLWMAGPEAGHGEIWLGHRLFQVLIDFVEEAFGGEPFLIWPHEQRQILGHKALFDGVDTDLLHGRGELGELVIAVQLGAMGEAARPGEDRSNGIGRGRLALLMLAVM